MSKAITWSQWFRVHVMRIGYVCRCGAFVPNDYRRLHEDFHDAARAFGLPPSEDELFEARRESEAR